MSPDYFLLPVALILLIAAAISMEKRGDSKTNSWMHTFGCWTAIIIAVWMLTWWGFHCVYNHDKLSTWITPNEFGDMFGALTCLFSGIAIAGVIAMLRQQHEEMKETRDEFAAQTEQFEAQTKQFQEQIELARQAQLRDDFYRRLELLIKLEDSLLYFANENFSDTCTIKTPKEKHGKGAFDYYYTSNMSLLMAIICSNNTLHEIAKESKFTDISLFVWIKNVLMILSDLQKENVPQTYKDILLSFIPPEGKTLIHLIAPILEDVPTDVNPEQEFPLFYHPFYNRPSEQVLQYHRNILKIKENPRTEISEWIRNNPPPPSSLQGLPLR